MQGDTTGAQTQTQTSTQAQAQRELSFPIAMKEFFGYRPGTGLKEFQEEIKALSPNDKAFFRAGLLQNGFLLKP